MPSLIARLGLDTRDYESGISRADNVTKSWATKQQKFLSGTFFKAFGAAAVFNEVKSILKEVDRISMESGKHGLSPERFQALESVANSTGASIEQLVEHAKELPPEINAAVAEFERLGKAIPENTISNLQDMLKAFRSAGQTTQKVGSTLLSGLWTGLKRMGFASFGTADFILGNLLGGGEVLGGKRLLDSADYWLNALFGDALGTAEGEGMTERLTQILALKRIKRAEAKKTEKGITAIGSRSQFRAESFDALNRIGGFAQRGDEWMRSPIERIAHATEETARNTQGGGSPY